MLRFSSVLEFAATSSRALQWLVDGLLFHSEILITFMRYREAFGAALLLGDFDGAEAHLNAVAATLGDSLWLAKSRITLTLCRGGLADVRFDANGDGVDLFILYHYAMLAAPELPPGPQVSAFIREISTLDVPLATFLSLLVMSRLEMGITHDQLDEVVPYFWAASPVDRLDTLLVALQTLCASMDGTDQRYADAIGRLASGGLAPWSLYNAYTGYVQHQGVDRAATSVANLYTLGNYHAAVASASREIRVNPCGLACLQLLVLACARAGESIPSFSEVAGAPVQDVLKALSNHGQPTRVADRGAAILHCAVLLSTTPIGMPLVAASEQVAFHVPPRIDGVVLSAASTSLWTPKDFLIRRPSPAVAPPALLQLEGDELLEPSVALLAYANGMTVDRNTLAMIPPYRLKKYAALRTAHEEPLRAIGQMVQLLDEPDLSAVDRADCVRFLWRHASVVKKADVLVDLLAWCMARQPEFVTSDRVEHAYRVAGRRPPLLTLNPFSWALLCWCRVQANDSNESRAALQYAFETVLRGHAKARPTMLEPPPYTSPNFPSYLDFLRHVCVPDVMDSCVLEFAVNPDNVQRERIAVLQ
ncbi:MAG: hypothetical protein H6738_17655, partial [Alphaproteobacteria bacterium]|nr:hypothetical protein [Alphaproteobacteria bacterium]